MKTRTAAAVICLFLINTSSALTDSFRFVFHSQGFITPRQNVYYHVFQFTNPESTVFLLGPMKRWNIDNSVVRGLIWFKADTDGNRWSGIGFWPTIPLAERVSVTLDSRYLIGLGNTSDQLQLIPWLDYALDKRNTFRLQASLTENLGDGIAQRWYLGPYWIYELTDNMQFRLGYQRGLEGRPERRLVLALNFNL